MKNYKGFTLVELMVTVLIASIVLLGLGAALADGHRGYNKLYNRINSEVVSDAYVSRAAFDSIIRKASAGSDIITASTATVYYYSGPGVAKVDRYAFFNIINNQLTVSEGTVTYNSSNNKVLGAPTTSRVLANNVQTQTSAFIKKEDNPCIQMILHLNNNKEDMVVTCSSIRHNR